MTYLRCIIFLRPPALGKMFYRARKKSGVETGMVIHPGDGRGIKQFPPREDVLRRTPPRFEKHDLPIAK